MYASPWIATVSWSKRKGIKIQIIVVCAKKRKCKKERSDQNKEDNNTKMVATNSKTPFNVLPPDMQPKWILGNKSERFRQKREIISLGKQVEKLKQNFKQSTKVCLNGSDGVDFLATNTETQQESVNQSVEQVGESANQHNTFMGVAIVPPV